MINIEDVKKKILIHALKGNLVRHFPQEGTGKELIGKIISLRLKKNKNFKYKDVNIEAVPFNIPDTWGWAYIETISETVGGKTNQIQTSEIKEIGDIPVVSQGKKNIDGYTSYSEKVISDIPIVLFGDHTKVVKYLTFPFVIGADGTKLFKSIGLDDKYFYYLISYASFTIFDLGYSRHYSLLKKCPLPIPPLEEQKRIVAKLDEIFSELDKIDEKQTRLTTIQDKMRTKILKLAIQGKLVSQNPEEGTGDELLKQVYKEKEKLIGQGLIRKDKPCPLIKEEEFPFKIPTSWIWCRFGQIISLTSGVDLEQKYYYPEPKKDSIPYITGASCVDRKGNLIINRFTNISFKNSSFGDLLITCKGTVGKISVNDSGDIHLARQLMGIKTFIDFDYTKYYLTFIVDELKDKVNGLIPGIDRPTILNFPFPLPPINEQKRIASKIKQILDEGR